MRNRTQHYDWGSRWMLPALEIGGAVRDESSGSGGGGGSSAEISPEPVAEVWMGTHPRGPSFVETSSGAFEPLAEVVGSAGTGEMPFLLKILTAERGLSIQTHPSRALAYDGYRREDAQGIDIAAPHRMYRDQNHKPELLCAVEDFWGLRGFRPLGELTSEMNRFVDLLPPAAAELRAALRAFVASPSTSSWRTAFAALLQAAEGAARTAVVAALEQYCHVSDAETDPPGRDDRYWWCRELSRQFPGDLGAAAPLYLNLVHLKPGEAIFLEAGVLHAYLYGAGVELMAASDNVLRAGCTSKHVDRPELLRALSFVFEPASVVAPEGKPCGSGVVQRYLTSAREFELLRCALPPGVSEGRVVFSKSASSVAVVLSLGGEARVVEAASADAASPEAVVPGRSVPLSPTESAVVTSETKQFVVELHARGVVYVAGVPGAITCSDGDG